MNKFERVWATVNLDAILENMDTMHKNLNANTMMLAVIKTDGYGHGALPIAEMFEKKGYVFGYAVATVEEALALRKKGIRKNILILGHVFESAYDSIISNEIRVTVFNYESAKLLSDYAIKLNKKAIIHIKVDTGMSRIGFSPNEYSIQIIDAISKLPMIEIEGIFTHFAKADYANKETTRKQFRIFSEFVDKVEQSLQHRVPIHHCANSAALMELPETEMDMVRAGIAMYGLWPSEEMRRDAMQLRPALSLKSHIIFIKEIEQGTSVSYGATYTADKKTRIATIPVGYGDGYPRMLSNRGHVIIRGKYAPIVGRICMDQFMVDVTDIPEAMELDEVILIGASETVSISAEEIGELSGRFNYELLCDINKRVPRIYMRNGKIFMQNEDI